MMWQRVADSIQKNGCHLSLDTKVQKIRWRNNSIQAVEVKRNGSTQFFSGTDFVSTMPIAEAIQRFDPPAPEDILDAARHLKYRDFITIALIINHPALFEDNWIYIHDPSVKVGRIQNYKNWSPFMVPEAGKTCIGMEYFCSRGDALWRMSDAELIALAKSELQTLELGNTVDVEDAAVARIPDAYPVYDSTYQRSLSTIKEFLKKFDNFQVIGRNGMHKYNNQDHSMMTAMLAVENILGANHDLWGINTDPVYHEEIRAASEEPMPADTAIMKAFAKMDKFALAISVGCVSGFLLFLATVIMMMKHGPSVDPSLRLLAQYFPGFQMNLEGAFLGLGYAFISGFLFAWTFAYLRNFLIGFRIYQTRRVLEAIRFRDYFTSF